MKNTEAIPKITSTVISTLISEKSFFHSGSTIFVRLVHFSPCMYVEEHYDISLTSFSLTFGHTTKISVTGGRFPKYRSNNKKKSLDWFEKKFFEINSQEAFNLLSTSSDFSSFSN